METGLDDSAPLVPVGGERSNYVAIDTARWRGSLPGFLARQVVKKSFRSYRLANLDANRVAAVPVLYQLA